MQRRTIGVLFLSSALATLTACSSDNNDNPASGGKSGSGGTGATGGTGGTGGDTGGTGGAAGSGGSAGACSPASLQSFTAPTDPGGGGILFAASGEVLAFTGYPFPPASPDDPAFVDGWDVHFDRLLVTLDKITISDNPDSVPGDESQTGGVVAEADGPWAVDLSHHNVNNLPGKGDPGEEAAPIVALTNQNKNGNAAFETDGTRYAFSFDTVPATANAKNVNLDADGLCDYSEMIDKGCERPLRRHGDVQGRLGLRRLHGLRS